MGVGASKGTMRMQAIETDWKGPLPQTRRTRRCRAAKRWRDSARLRATRLKAASSARIREHSLPEPALR